MKKTQRIAETELDSERAVRTRICMNEPADPFASPLHSCTLRILLLEPTGHVCKEVEAAT
jgi:hypothetical protein